MKVILVLLLTLLTSRLFSTSAPTQYRTLPTLSAEATYERLAPLVYYIATMKGNEEQAHGSGFLYCPGPTSAAVIVTAKHVVHDRKKDEKIVLTDSKGHKFAAGQIIESKDYDIAVISIGATPGTPTFQMRNKEAQVGETVYGAGFPLHEPLTFTSGIVEGYWNGNDFAGGDRMLNVSCGLSPGDSGCPIVDSHGEVVGMFTVYSGAADYLRYCVATPLLRNQVHRLMEKIKSHL